MLIKKNEQKEENCLLCTEFQFYSSLDQKEYILHLNLLLLSCQTINKKRQEFGFQLLAFPERPPR